MELLNPPSSRQFQGYLLESWIPEFFASQIFRNHNSGLLWRAPPSSKNGLSFFLQEELWLLLFKKLRSPQTRELWLLFKNLEQSTDSGTWWVLRISIDKWHVTTDGEEIQGGRNKGFECEEQHLHLDAEAKKSNGPSFFERQRVTVITYPLLWTCWISVLSSSIWKRPVSDSSSFPILSKMRHLPEMIIDCVRWTSSICGQIVKLKVIEEWWWLHSTIVGLQKQRGMIVEVG